MTIKNLWPKVGVFSMMMFVIFSCQEDLSTIGSEVLGTETPSGILDDSHTLIAYSKKLTPVQSNDLPGYQFGVYNDPVYGKSAISFLTQLKLEEIDPKFGENPTVDSVFVYIPFFSSSTVQDSVTTYRLDSIYGSSPVNITISESNYFLRELDPDSGFKDPQPYYSNQGPLFAQYLGEELATQEGFVPNNKGFVLRKGEDDEEQLAPGLRVPLSADFFQERILDMEGSQELRNNNNFKNFMRGLYLQVNTPTNDGNLFIFDPAEAFVAIHYSFDGEDDPDQREHKTFKLEFGDIHVNTFDNAPIPNHIQSELDNPNTVEGNNNLYLRGGDGIISVVELFGPDSDNNGVPDELELLRAKKWLINEANLVFYVNQNSMAGGTNEPERIMVYNLETSDVLADFMRDPTSGLPPLDAMTNHYGRLKRGSDGKGDYYKLRITNHVSNLINKDSINVPLGIVVSQNVLNQNTQKLLDPMAPTIEKVPSGTVVSHQGTVLHGNTSINDDKRLKLQIYYTNPE